MAEALPVLATARLRLRPRTMDDVEASVAMDREPGTLDWVDWEGAAGGGWDDPAAHRAFVESRVRGPYPAGMGYWAIARREHPAEFLGWVLLIPEAATGTDAEIGWRLVTAARGQGYATEAARALLPHAFGTLKLPRIVAEIYRGNAASVAIARKLGMQASPEPVPGKPGADLWALEQAEWPT